MAQPSPLGFGLGLRPVYYHDILEKNPRVDWFEVISENFMVPGGRPLAILERIRSTYPIVMHGIFALSCHPGFVKAPPCGYGLIRGPVHGYCPRSNRRFREEGWEKYSAAPRFRSTYLARGFGSRPSGEIYVCMPR